MQAPLTSMPMRFVVLLAICWLAIKLPTAVGQQPQAGAPTPAPATPQQITTPKGDELTPAAQKVDVNPVARDEEIRARLQRVLEATDWFDDPEVRVDEGVVFLYGRTSKEELRKWAGNLARNTQDVVAVVNHVELAQPAIFDFSPAWTGIWGLWREFVRSLPFLLFAFLILACSIGAGIGATKLVRIVFCRRMQSKLLLNVVSRTIGVFVFLIGTYVVLRIAGLTQLALSVVGGTGLVGLALGIAFRDITENFLASIFLSLQKPFKTGDFIEVGGVQGFVQQLNIRTTVLMTLEGHLMQVPNGSVYKSNLRNYSVNWKLREDFTIGIGYDDDLPQAQEIARKILEEHPAVLDDPEPWVLVDNLAASAVNLRLYFWFNGREHSNLKLRSSLIRLVVAAFREHGILTPDEVAATSAATEAESTSEKGIPVEAASPPGPTPRFRVPALDGKTVATKAEAGLSSAAADIKAQARQMEPLKQEENLLKGSDHNGAAKPPKK